MTSDNWPTPYSSTSRSTSPTSCCSTAAPICTNSPLPYLDLPYWWACTHTPTPQTYTFTHLLSTWVLKKTTHGMSLPSVRNTHQYSGGSPSSYCCTILILRSPFENFAFEAFRGSYGLIGGVRPPIFHISHTVFAPCLVGGSFTHTKPLSWLPLLYAELLQYSICCLCCCYVSSSPEYVGGGSLWALGGPASGLPTSHSRVHQLLLPIPCIREATRGAALPWEGDHVAEEGEMPCMKATLIVALVLCVR